jgi:hypothetical protein
MTIARVLSYVGGFGTTSASAVYVSTPVQNNLMVAWGRGVAAANGGSISGWSKAVEVQFGATSGFLAIFYKIAGSGEGKTITYTGGASVTSCQVTIEESSGLSNSSGVLDKTSFVANTGSTVSSRSSGSTVTTTCNSELCLAGFSMGNTITAQSFTNSYTSEFGYPTTGILMLGASLIVSSTGSQETTASWTTARLAGGCIATFKSFVGKQQNIIGNQSVVRSTTW